MVAPGAYPGDTLLVDRLSDDGKWLHLAAPMMACAKTVEPAEGQPSNFTEWDTDDEGWVIRFWEDEVVFEFMGTVAPTDDGDCDAKKKKGSATGTTGLAQDEQCLIKAKAKIYQWVRGNGLPVPQDKRPITKADVGTVVFARSSVDGMEFGAKYRLPAVILDKRPNYTGLLPSLGTDRPHDGTFQLIDMSDVSAFGTAPISTTAANLQRWDPFAVPEVKHEMAWKELGLGDARITSGDDPKTGGIQAWLRMQYGPAGKFQLNQPVAKATEMKPVDGSGGTMLAWVIRPPGWSATAGADPGAGDHTFGVGSDGKATTKFNTSGGIFKKQGGGGLSSPKANFKAIKKAMREQLGAGLSAFPSPKANLPRKPADDKPGKPEIAGEQVFSMKFKSRKHCTLFLKLYLEAQQSLPDALEKQDPAISAGKAVTATHCLTSPCPPGAAPSLAVQAHATPSLAFPVAQATSFKLGPAAAAVGGFGLPPELAARAFPWDVAGDPPQLPDSLPSSGL